MKIQLIKDESIFEFLEYNLINGDEVRRDNGQCGGKSAHSYLRDVIYVKNTLFTKTQQKQDNLTIELLDNMYGNKRELITTYIYEPQRYDDISTKLVLVDFKVRLK